MVEVLQGSGFRRAYKKLQRNQKAAVDDAVEAILENPALGEMKLGDLAGVQVYKFQCVKQQFLLAYEYDPATCLLLLVGTHENFYQELKR